ncbi:hypothetical protein IVB27_32500 [Bradyrhizobium sp. 197]|uniref:hypothetical protein n=1 Tax=Bradyrhizobium sp. 197 TaxID=2782663 RepID=UPI001FFBD2FA|nr:hypothetical protein [Bradyrhizobium sp. 197]MCK1479336.1 hypothetical protein [Bradyrhizobium sp. 197]
MWTWLASFLGGPVIKGLIDAYKAKLEAGSNQDTLAADLAGKDLELQAKERELNVKQNQADEGRWWTAAPRAIVCWSFAIYVAKVVVWDMVLHFGTTLPLKGDIAAWGGSVMVMWFGGRTIEKVARIWRPR